jgi:seryl-tRNA synthetase
MLTLNFIRENTSLLIERQSKRGIDVSGLVKQIIELDDQRKAIQGEQNAAQAEINVLSKKIGQLFKEGKKEEAEQVRSRTGKLKDSIKDSLKMLTGKEKDIRRLLVQIPNIPHESVPEGKLEQDNVLIGSKGKVIEADKDDLPHWELIKKYDIIDFDLGNKLTGAGFPVYKNKGAKLQRALISFFLDEAIKAGYEEVIPPLMVNEDSGFGTGQLPDKEGQMYHVSADNYYLIPTAEVPVTNIYRDVILQEDQLPVKNTAYTPCFRREAGSWGKDVRGLNRLHQFDKVEIVQIAQPAKSYDILEEMVQHVAGLLDKLKLPYRIMQLCGGDLGFAAALTYDFEVYAPAQKKWLEVSSVSNFEDYQANRLKLRYKAKGEKKAALAHTLNGSALALPRVVAALIENNQTENGVMIPEALRPYTGFDFID